MNTEFDWLIFFVMYSCSESSESVEMKQIRRLVSTDSATRSDVRSQPAPNAWQAFRVTA